MDLYSHNLCDVVDDATWIIQAAPSRDTGQLVISRVFAGDSAYESNLPRFMASMPQWKNARISGGLHSNFSIENIRLHWPQEDELRSIRMVQSKVYKSHPRSLISDSGDHQRSKTKIHTKMRFQTPVRGYRWPLCKPDPLWDDNPCSLLLRHWRAMRLPPSWRRPSIRGLQSRKQRRM